VSRKVVRFTHLHSLKLKLPINLLIPRKQFLKTYCRRIRLLVHVDRLFRLTLKSVKDGIDRRNAMFAV